jgi:hypothetical protein
VKTDPVVGKHRVGLAGLVGVRRDADGDAFAGQRRGERVEFRLRLQAGLLRTTGALEAIAGRGLGVEPEVSRANHEHRARTL